MTINAKAQNLDQDLDQSDDFVGGEYLNILERIVISKSIGLFKPENLIENRIKKPIHQNTIIGYVGDQEITAPFSGYFMGFLAIEGQRVNIGTPIAWLRLEEETIS